MLPFLESKLKMDLETINLSSVQLGRLRVRRGCFALFVVVVVVVPLCRVVLGIFGNWYGWWLVVLVSLIEISIVTLGCFIARTLSRQNSLSQAKVHSSLQEL